MRVNQPVSQKECPIPDQAAIISRTDAKGIITHVHDDFVVLSGFTRAELVGQPHNIVRHPDMPQEAFRDLWDTLQAGRPWTGVVKNRCKNGDHYWVKATATPTSDGGYMSVRVKPSRDEVRAAEALYARMRQDPGIRLKGGQLRKGGLATLMGHFMDIGLATKMWITTLASMVAVLAAAMLGWSAQGLVLGDLPPRSAHAIAPYRTGLLAVVGVTLVVWPLVAWWVIRHLNRPLQQAVEAAKGIAAFDFFQPVPLAGGDEVGQLLRQFAIMRNNLQERAVQVLKDSSRASAHAAAEQSDTSSSMAAAVEELSVSIDQMEEHAREASSVASQAGEASREGSRVVHHTADEIGRVAGSVNASAATIRATCWPSTPPSRRPGPGSRDGVSPWWRTRCANWRSAPPIPRCRQAA
jgi:aerotaxis receptor